jgi:hypothetical protein
MKPDFNQQGKTDKQNSDSARIMVWWAVAFGVFIVCCLAYYAGINWGWIEP